MGFSRRQFLTLTGLGVAGTTMVAPLAAFSQRIAQGLPIGSRGFGAPIPQLPLNTAELPPALRNLPLLELPPGFTYRALSISTLVGGTPMTDGNPVPALPDGMGAFAGPKGTTILVRNHELLLGPGVNAPTAKKYDPNAAGGTTSLLISNSGQLLAHGTSLAGTRRNCAGGPTPWGSWLSCEEDFSTSGAGIRHGYVFEVPSRAIGPVDPVPLVAMGRFNHEAAAVDPATGYVYETEDRGDSCFYRFRPHQPGQLQAGGTLEALVIQGSPAVITSQGFQTYLGQPLPVSWVTLNDVDPATDTVRYEAQSKGAAIFERGEGTWYGNGLIYFVGTTAGDANSGQIWAYDPVNNTITLLVESQGSSDLDAPDNITIAPFGDLFLCEDGDGKDRVVGLTAEGTRYEFLRNAVDRDTSEFCGACFSPDGQWFFVNNQGLESLKHQGITFAITGPWEQGFTHRQRRA